MNHNQNNQISETNNSNNFDSNHESAVKMEQQTLVQQHPAFQGHNSFLTGQSMQSMQSDDNKQDFMNLIQSSTTADNMMPLFDNQQPGQNNALHSIPLQQNQQQGRNRTVTMDSILNTVTSDESINLSDYSKVYSALNPTLMKPNRYSAPIMHHFENNLNFPSPPNTPLIMRPYQSTNHGLSNLNPLSNNDQTDFTQFQNQSSNQNFDQNQFQAIQSNYSIPDYTVNENPQQNLSSKLQISDYSTAIDLPQLFDGSRQSNDNNGNGNFSFQNQQPIQQQQQYHQPQNQYNQLVHPNVQQLLSLDNNNNLYNEHNSGSNSNSPRFTMPPHQIQHNNQSNGSYSSQFNADSPNHSMHHSNSNVSQQQLQGNHYQSSSNNGTSYADSETYTYDENNKAIRIYKCPRPLCTKIYKNANGLKYHMENGVCEVDSSSNDATLFTDPATCDQMAMSQIKLAKRPYWCRIIGCGKKYKNLNGLKYHGKVNHPDLDFTKHVKGHHAHPLDENESEMNM